MNKNVSQVVFLYIYNFVQISFAASYLDSVHKARPSLLMGPVL